MGAEKSDVEMGWQETERHDVDPTVSRSTLSGAQKTTSRPHHSSLSSSEKNTPVDVEPTEVITPSSNKEVQVPDRQVDHLHRSSTHRSRIPKPNLTAIARTITTRSNASLLDPGPPPDGGTKAWTQACMGHLVILNTWGMVATFGVFQTYYTEELGLEPSAVSWIGSIQMLGHFGLGMLSCSFLGLFMGWGAREHRCSSEV
jgi:hypothetical protein